MESPTQLLERLQGQNHSVQLGALQGWSTEAWRTIQRLEQQLFNAVGERNDLRQIIDDMDGEGRQARREQSTYVYGET